MKRKIYKKVSGYFYDHHGNSVSVSFHIYADGHKWVCKRNGYLWYYPRIFFIAERFSGGEWLEVPRNPNEREREAKKLEDMISRCVDFLRGNPLSGSYNSSLRQLEEIKKEHFTNSIDFIRELE